MLSKTPKIPSPYQVAFPSLKKPPFILDESMPIYSPTGFLDITNATLRTSNLEAQNFRLNGGNIYVTSELTTDELLNLDNVVNAGNTTSNTVQFTNTTTGLVVDSNIVVAGNVTAGSFLGDGSGLTSIPPSAITGTLSQWSDGTNSDVYIASNVGIGNVHTLTSNTLQVGANLYVRDADANVLTVTGNVAADYFEGDGSKLTGISSTLQAITDSGNVTSNTVQFSNATTGFVTTSNIEVGGALKINTITAAAYHSLQAVTNVGNVTSNTVQFSNATTGLVTTGNVEVGRDLSVTGNLTVLGTRTIVDTDTLRVKDPIIELGKDNPGTGDLGLVMTRPSGSSNVAVVFDESTDTLEIGYTQSNASDTDITMRTAATEPLDVNVNGNVSVGKELTVSGNVAVDTDTLVVDSVNDRVGIGTMTPLSDLDLYNPAGTELIVSRNAGSSVNPTIRLWNFDDNNYNNHAVGTSVGTINFSGNERLTGDTHTDDSRAFSYANTLYDWARISALFVGSSDSATTSQGNVRGDLAFYTNGGDVATSDLQERMRIKHNGNVGIGTTTPVAKFEVYGDTILSHGSGYTHNSDDRTLYIGGRNNNGSLQQGKCAIVATPSTSHGGGGVYGRNALHFCVGPDANNDTSASKADSRLCITHTGNVGIGTTSPESSLEVHGTGIHINGTVLRSYSAMGAMTGGQWYKVCDFSALPATTVGVCAIRIQWSGGSLTNVGTYYWSGHASGIVPYNTYGNGSGIYNAAPSEPLTLNQRYHHRTSGAFEFILDSDGSGGSYGRQSIYIKTPQSLSNLSLEVIAMPLRR